MGVTASCDAGNAENEFLLMQAKDLSNELRYTRSVCDNLKDELHHNQSKMERAENDKKQLKFAVKHLNAKIEEYQMLIEKLRKAYNSDEYFDNYEDGGKEDILRGTNYESSGIQVTPTDEKEIQTNHAEITADNESQCSILSQKYLQNICNEIDSQILSVDNLIQENESSLNVLGILIGGSNDDDDTSTTKDTTLSDTDKLQ